MEERLLRLAQQAGLVLTCDAYPYGQAARHGQRWRPGGVASAENERRCWPLTPASLLSLRFGLAPTAPPTPTSRRRPRPRLNRRSHGQHLGRRTLGYARCLECHPSPARWRARCTRTVSPARNCLRVHADLGLTRSPSRPPSLYPSPTHRARVWCCSQIRAPSRTTSPTSQTTRTAMRRRRTTIMLSVPACTV